MAHRKAAWLLAAVCAWHLLLSLNALRLPMVADEGEYAYAARAWSAGGLPYRDAYLQKPPSIALVFRAAQALSDDPRAPRVLALIAVWATCVLLYAASPPRWPLAARLAPAAAYASLSALPVGDYSFPANPEVFLAVCASWAFLHLARFLERGRRAKDAALCGLALGAALSFKQTALWALVGFAAIAAWRPQRAHWRAAGLIVGAAATIPLAWALYFAARGGLAALVDQVWARNRLYGAIVSGPDALAFQLSWFARALAPGLAWGAWPAALLALYGCGERFARERLAEAGAAVWLGAGLTGAATGFFLFPHYFLQAAPPLAFLCGAGARRLPRRAAAWAAVAAGVWPALAFGRLLFAADGPALARRLLYPNPVYEARTLGAFARTLTEPGEPIYVFGSEAQIYEYARRPCATPHEVVYSLTMFPRSRRDISDELAALDRARPKVVVYSAQPFSAILGSRLGVEFRDAVRARLAKGYTLVGRSTIGPAGSATILGAQGLKGQKPDWDDESSLYVFERRG